MNNKQITYKDAVKALKKLEKIQTFTKQATKSKSKLRRQKYQRDREDNKIKINSLLSLISAKKQAMKYYGILKEVRSSLGISSKEYKLVNDVLNEA